MNEKERYEIDKIQSIAQGLASLPQTERVVKVNKTQTVKLLLNDIKAAQAKGYTVEQISEYLKQQGINISVTLIRNALSKAKTVRGRPKTKKNSKSIDEISSASSSNITEQRSSSTSSATPSRDASVGPKQLVFPPGASSVPIGGGRFVPAPDSDVL
jgi:hypothetical protein